MAQEIVGIKVEVDGGQATQSVGSIKKQLKEANAELIAAQKNFGDYSKEAITAAKRVAELKDSVAEAAETAALFDPGKKFQALSGTLTTVAGGFTAVQGAIGLLGVESKEVEKQLLKVQSALALSQGLSTITDGAKDFQRLAAVIKTSVTGAFSSLRSAIISTGIGALVVGVGLLIANFEEVKKVLLNLFPGLGKLASFVGKLVQQFTDFVGITSQAERNLDALEKKTKRGNEEIQNRIKVLQAQGGKEKEVYQLSKQLADDELKFLREKLKSKGQLSEEELKQFRDLKNQKEVLDAAEQKRVNDQAAAAASKAKAEREKRIEEEKKAREKLYAEEDKATQTRSQARILSTEDEKRKELEGKTALNNRLIEIDTSRGVKDMQNLQAAFLEKKKINDAEKALAKAKADAEIGYAQMALNIVGGLVDQNSVAGKAIAVVQAIINTYQGASRALAQTGVFGPVAAAATIAAGLIQVRKIISTKIPSAKGTGTVADTGGGGMTMAAAPIGPTAPIQNTVTQLDQGTINRMGSATSRAYVVESDITNSQEKITRINRAARLG